MTIFDTFQSSFRRQQRHIHIKERKMNQFRIQVSNFHIYLFLLCFMISIINCGKDKGGHTIIVSSGGGKEKCEEKTKYVPVPIPVPRYRHGKSFGHFTSSSAMYQSLGSFPPRVWTQPYLSLKKLAKKGRKKKDHPKANQGKFGEKVKRKKGMKGSASTTNFYAIPLERRIQLVPQLTNRQLPLLPHSFIPNLIGSAINQQSAMNPFFPRSAIFNPPIVPPVPRSVMVPRMDYPMFQTSPFSNQPLAMETRTSMSQPGGTSKFWWEKGVGIDEWNKHWDKESSRRWDNLLAAQDEVKWSPPEEKWSQPASIHSYSTKDAPFDLLPSDGFSPSFIRK